MKIDKDLILRLEHLARLELSGTEREQMVKDMKNIMDMVERLQEVDTDEVDPLVYMNESSNRLRKDEVKNELPIEDALKNAPKTEGNYFLVPKVIDK